MSNKIPPILEDLFLKNLRFFKKTSQGVYDLINKINLSHTQIIIDDNGRIDLIYQGASIYHGDAIQCVQDEVKGHLNICKSGGIDSPIFVPNPKNYLHPRFFHKRINKTYRKILDVTEGISPNIKKFKGKHEFLVVMGISLGLHISELLDNIEIDNILIFESDSELLTISMFFTDWENIYSRFPIKEGKSIKLILSGTEDQEHNKNRIWNELILRTPHFPINTVYYNHRNQKKYNKIIKEVQKDMPVYMSTWGFYDDEVNQLNHILHNVKSNHKMIPEKNNFKWDKPIIICGSGPSLDERISQLKSIRENCILISAGTSLSVLLNNDLIPDYHIELESDYLVYTVLNNIKGKEKLKKISLISAIQCTPLIQALFKDCSFYAKSFLPSSDIITKRENTLSNPAPTCVNAALSIALHYQCESVYLFGTDFGFYDDKKHHSKDSIYVDKDKSTHKITKIVEKNVSNYFESDGYHGTCKTTTAYFTTKNRIESEILRNKNKYRFNVYNCSDGLLIKNTKHINNNNMIKLESTSSKYNFIASRENIPDNRYEEIIEKTNYSANFLCEQIIFNLEKLEPNIESLSNFCWKTTDYIEIKYHQDFGSLSYFMRGTIMHFLYCGYSTAITSSKENTSKIIKIWKENFLLFLKDLPKDLRRQLNKSRKTIENDQQLHKTISEPL